MENRFKPTPFELLPKARKKRVTRIFNYLHDHCDLTMDVDDEKILPIAKDLEVGDHREMAGLIKPESNSAAVFKSDEKTLFLFVQWWGNREAKDNGWLLVTLSRPKTLKVVKMGIFSFNEITSAVLFFSTFDGDRLNEIKVFDPGWN